VLGAQPTLYEEGGVTYRARGEGDSCPSMGSLRKRGFQIDSRKGGEEVRTDQSKKGNVSLFLLGNRKRFFRVGKEDSRGVWTQESERQLFILDSERQRVARDPTKKGRNRWERYSVRGKRTCWGGGDVVFFLSTIRYYDQNYLGERRPRFSRSIRRGRTVCQQIL